MIYSLKSKTHFRNILRTFLLILGITFSVSAFWITLIFLIVGVYFIVMSMMIRDKEINVYSDRFELVGISWVSLFNNKEVFKYELIKKVNFDKRFTNIISIALYDSAFSPVTSSKPDTIEIFFHDGSFRILNRIGKREEFIECFKHIAIEMKKMMS